MWVLADHPIHTALPFFVPSLLVMGVIGAVMLRDRRRGDPDDDPDDDRDDDPGDDGDDDPGPDA